MHLRAAKQLVEAEGGLQAIEALDAPLYQKIVRADLGRAICTLSGPVFSIARERASTQLACLGGDLLLDLEAEDVICQLAETDFPGSVATVIRDMTQAAQMLAYIWTCAEQPGTTLTAISDIVASAIYAVLYSAISLKVDEGRRQKFEATRTLLILWLQLLRRSARGGRGSGCLLGFLTISNDEAMGAKREARIWSADLYTLVKTWNKMQRNIPKVNVKADRATPMSLVRLVQVMEWESAVKLGSLMERLFELEEEYWRRKDTELWAWTGMATRGKYATTGIKRAKGYDHNAYPGHDWRGRRQTPPRDPTQGAIHPSASREQHCHHEPSHLSP